MATAASILLRATNLILDDTSVRWTVGELVRYLNDAQREVALLRPDAMNRTVTGQLIQGARQSLTAMGLNPAPSKLIEITRNMAAGSDKGAVRMVPRNMLDAQTPNWHNLTPVVNVRHYTFDARDPTTFYVYPPATSAAQLEIMYSAVPTDIVEPAPGTTVAAVAGNISLPDSFANALVDYVLYRAYSKDAEFAGNEGRASAHYAAFNASLASEIKATLAVQPQLKPGMASA